MKTNPIQVVIGLGTDVSKNGRACSPQSKAIALKCVELAKQLKIKNIFFSGGNAPKGTTEAELMAELAMKQGRFIIGEDRNSHTTVGNLINTVSWLRENKFKKGLIVATPLHLIRTKILVKFMHLIDIDLAFKAAKSPLGGGHQLRLCCWPSFIFWNVFALPLDLFRLYLHRSKY